jgi:hypothetical protein
MKNLMVNGNFICRAALMSGDDVKKFLFWSYNYAVNDLLPTDEELDASKESVYNSFSEYIKYIDCCKQKYADRVQRTLQEQEMENNAK